MSVGAFIRCAARKNKRLTIGSILVTLLSVPALPFRPDYPLRAVDAACHFRDHEPVEGDVAPTWFIADELDAIGKIEGLDDALQRIRKFGGRCALVPNDRQGPVALRRRRCRGSGEEL